MGGVSPRQPGRWGHTGVMRVVGLLRGVNLGPSRKLKMAELRAAVALFTLLPLPVTGHATSWRWPETKT